MGIIIPLIILIASLYVVSCLFPKRFKDSSHWKDLLMKLSTAVMNYYCVTTVGKVLMYAFRAINGAYFAITIGLPLISIIYTPENFSIIVKWNDTDTHLTIIYMILNVALALGFIWYKKFNTEEIRQTLERQEKQNEEILGGIESIKKTVIGNDTSKRAMIIQNLRTIKDEDLKNLKFSSALKHINTLLNQCEEFCFNDDSLLARIKHTEGCCLKYIDSNTAVIKFKEAYLLEKNPDQELLNNYVFALCYENKLEEANEFVLTKRDSVSANWTYIPKFLQSDDKSSFFDLHHVTDENLIEEILAESIILAQILNLELDLKSFPIKIDYNIPLTYNTLSKWILQLSYSLTNLLADLHFPFRGNNISTQSSEVHYMLSKKILEHKSVNEIKCHLPDLELYYAYAGFLHDQKPQWISMLLEQLDKCHNRNFAYIAISFILLNQDKGQQAIELLSKYENRNTELSWLLISLLFNCMKSDEITFEMQRLIDRQMVVIPCSSYNVLLALIRLYPDQYSKIAANFQCETESHTEIFHKFIEFFNGDTNVARVLIDKDNNDPLFKSAYPYVYKSAGEIEIAIQKTKEILIPDSIDAVAHLYVELLKEATKYTELLSYLRTLRKAGYNYPPFLNQELSLVCKMHNYKEAVEICDILHTILPDDASVIYNKLMAYYSDSQIPNDINKLIDNLNSHCYSIEHIKNIFKILQTFERRAEALEFLYTNVLKHNSQELRDFFFSVHLNPNFEEFFTSELNIASEGDYITISDESIERDICIRANSTFAEFIGKPVGHQICINKGVKSTTITLLSISTKYQGLAKEVAQEITNNHSANFKCFSFDDIKDNPVEGLQKAVEAYNGVPAQIIAETRKKHYLNYQQGNLPLFIAGPNIDDLTSIYNLIFGEFRILQVPTHIQKQRWGNYCIDESISYVLDISSLIVMHFICRKFQIVLNCRLKIPKSVVDFVKENIASIKRDGILPSLSIQIQTIVAQWFNSDATNTLSPILNDLLDWIEENCEVLIVEEIIEHDNSFDHIPLSLQMDCLVLSQRSNHVLITEDYWMQNQIGIPKKINVEYFFEVLTSKKNKDISRTLTELNYLGQYIDSDYIIAQIKQSEYGDNESFRNTLHLLSQNPFVIEDFIRSADSICSGIITPVRINKIQIVFQTLFEALTYPVAKHVYNQLMEFKICPLLKNCITNSFASIESTQIIIYPESKKLII